jgi:hypothetical protein
MFPSAFPRHTAGNRQSHLTPPLVLTPRWRGRFICEPKNSSFFSPPIASSSSQIAASAPPLRYGGVCVALMHRYWKARVRPRWLAWQLLRRAQQSLGQGDLVPPLIPSQFPGYSRFLLVDLSFRWVIVADSSRGSKRPTVNTFRGAKIHGEECFCCQSSASRWPSRICTGVILD